MVLATNAVHRTQHRGPAQLETLIHYTARQRQLASCLLETQHTCHEDVCPVPNSTSNSPAYMRVSQLQQSIIAVRHIIDKAGAVAVPTA